MILSLQFLFSALLVGTHQATAYQSMMVPPSISFYPRSTSLQMKRGRGSLGREVSGNNSSNSAKNKGMGSKDSGFASSNNYLPSRWCTVPKGQTLPTEENKVTLLTTNLPTLIDKGINPTGAVSVLKYNNDMYCFSVNCPCCKIPLTKATAKEKDVLECNFCKSTYSLTTGQRLETNSNSKGLFGGIVQSVLSSSPDNKGPLQLYQLGEDANGKLLIDPAPGSGASK
jgi:nitrite reductase/ring-hydroxylating ferredoxin subunit